MNENGIETIFGLVSDLSNAITKSVADSKFNLLDLKNFLPLLMKATTFPKWKDLKTEVRGMNRTELEMIKDAIIPTVDGELQKFVFRMVFLALEAAIETKKTFFADYKIINNE